MNLKAFSLAAVFLLAAAFCGAEELKVLMIGNSFSQSVLRDLPNIVKASGKDKLKLAQAMIGGCSMQRHCAEYRKSEAAPAHRPYWTNLNLDNRPKNKVSLQDLLTADQWDIVTIQQASHESWNPESFRFAEELIGIIRKHQPKAEIVIQQTWSYRADDPRIMLPKPKWGFDQNGMYERLTDNYRALAKKYGFRIIPTGFAVQIVRGKTVDKFEPCDPAVRKALNPPDLPKQAGDVVGKFYWIKRRDGMLHIDSDTIHLNRRGEYLQGCVWYIFLFKRTAADIKFVPKSISDPDARFLAECAEEAVRSFK